MDQSASSSATTSPAVSLPDSRYTAVVYFHGMGNQRRYEEVSSLLTQLDNLVFIQRGASTQRYLDVRPIALERGRRGSGMDRKSVAYYEVRNPCADRNARDPDRSPSVRFYESYWADYTAGGTKAFSTFNWVVRQWHRPLTVLLANWGEVAALRIGSLYAYYERKKAAAERKGQPLSPNTLRCVEYLIDTYHSFIEPDSRYDDQKRDRYRGNKFADFELFLKDNLELQAQLDPSWDAELSQEILTMARAWRRADQWAQLSYLFVTFSLLVTLIFSVILAAWIIYALVMSFISINRETIPPVVEQFFSFLPFELTTNRMLFVAMVLILAGFGLYGSIKSFFSEYMGDVHQYLTYQETDEKYAQREAILESGVSLLRHVMMDERCERIVVVAHSLGSVIAYDTLLALRRLDWVQRSADTSWAASLELAGAAPGAKKRTDTTLRLDKIKHFITLGSPIDKVIYFFAAIQSRVPRFVETNYALRGDVSQPPFTWRDNSEEGALVRPHIHWVNYWDRADVISGPIYNIIGSRVRSERVDNVRVASYLIPNPGKSHGGYFDHRLVLQDIFEIIFKNKYSFVDSMNRALPQQWFADQACYRDDVQGHKLYLVHVIIQHVVLALGILLTMAGVSFVLPSFMMLIFAVGLFFLGFFLVSLVIGQLGNGSTAKTRFSVDPYQDPLPIDLTAELEPAPNPYAEAEPLPSEEPPRSPDELTPEESLESLLGQPVPEADSSDAPLPQATPPDSHTPPLPDQPLPVRHQEPERDRRTEV